MYQVVVVEDHHFLKSELMVDLQVVLEIWVELDLVAVDSR